MEDKTSSNLKGYLDVEAVKREVLQDADGMLADGSIHT